MKKIKTLIQVFEEAHLLSTNKEQIMLAEPNCHKRNCKHFLGVDQPDGTEMTERVICEAFPNGIPEEIAYGSNKHEKMHPDQEGDFVYTKE